MPKFSTVCIVAAKATSRSRTFTRTAIQQREASSMAMVVLVICLSLVNFMSSCNASPLTIPLTPEGEVSGLIPDYFESKKTKAFHLLSPHQNYPVHELDLDLHEACNLDFKLKWTRSLGSPVFSSPVVFSASATSHFKNIFVATYQNFIEMLQGNGQKSAGWPITFENSVFQSSPLVYDIDGDGHTDIGVVDRDANLFWIRIGDFGKYLEDYHVQVPKLKIKRDWFEVIRVDNAETYNMVSMFDRYRGREATKSPLVSQRQAKLDPLSETESKKSRKQKEEDELGNRKAPVRRRLSEVSQPEETVDGASELDIDHGEGDGVFDLDFSKYNPEEGTPFPKDGDLEYGDFPNAYSYGSSNTVRRTDDGVGYYMSRRYGDPEWSDSAFLAVDAHVLATPAMADINKDGHMEIVFPISYYFDKEEYEGREIDFDPEMYVASALACWDMQAQSWSWTVHLDLSSTRSKFQALLHASPTAADLDGDGRMEIIVGTSMGTLYVIDGESGFVRRFFPMQFHSIQAQVAVADLTGGPHLEMIVADMGGTVAVVSAEGDILWDTQLSGSVVYTPTIGDVNADGILDVVVVTMGTDKKCHVWALSGDTGGPLEGFPIALPEEATIGGPVLIVDLEVTDEFDNPVQRMSLYNLHRKVHKVSQLRSKTPSDILNMFNNKNQTTASTMFDEQPTIRPYLVITAFEGYVYLVNVRKDDPLAKKTVNGINACVERIGTGGNMYAPPLIEDVTDDGFLDIVAANLNGELMVFESSVPYHPANTWSSFPKHQGLSFTHADISISVSYLEKERLKQLELRGGQNLTLAFEVFDRKCHSNPCEIIGERKYFVRITRGSNHLEPVWTGEFSRAGKYLASIPIEGPEQSVFVLSLQTEHGLYAEDSVAVTISTKFYVWIKYFVLAPIMLFALLVYAKLSTIFSSS